MTFGAYSLLLSIAAANGAFLATLLLTRTGRHSGSQWLAALIAGIALRMMPYILGFAGGYDLHPGLTFAPFDVTLAWGPLLWMYVVVLSTGAPPQRWLRHFFPVAVQFAYQLGAFALPTQLKLRWYGGTHLAVVEPIGTVLVLVSLAAYGLCAYRQYEAWQSWLDGNLSNREESRLDWLRLVLAGFGLTGAIGVVLAAVNWGITPLDYFARLPVIVALAILSYVIALLGYRFGGLAIPMTESTGDSTQAAIHSADAARDLEPDALTGIEMRPPARVKDYAVEATEWRSRVIAEGWHRDAGLTLARLAELLRTSTRSVSRTLNEGRGESFNDFINRIRVEEAAVILARPDSPDVLRVAFEVGFASKASFNRAFQRHLNSTPSSIRTQSQTDASQLPPI